ncbi:MAG: sensor domain-containing diguanylate cyclase [Pseudomonadota bacterium]|nr:sensor domain-containing diguanylate cyclase [Pseudomonadota bacterium]
MATWLLLASGMASAQVQLEQTPLEQMPLEQAPLVLDAASSQVTLAPHVGYYHDTEASTDIDVAVQLARQGEFAPLPAGSTTFGFQPGAFWFHARIVNRHPIENRWLLVQQYPLSDRIDVYLRHADGRIAHQAGGDHLPFASRSVTYRHPNFWLTLPGDQPVELFVRVQSQSSMQVPLVLFTPTAFAESERDTQFVIGLYYGILLALFFYNLVLWLSLRDPSYFWYLFHITAFGLVLFTLNGLGFEYLWPDSAWLADKSVPLSICLSQVGMLQFTRTFLDLRSRWVWGDRISLVLMMYFVVLGLASIQLPYRISTPIASISVFLNILWIVIGTLVVMLRGYKPAQLFLLAWSMFLLGTMLFVALAFGVLPKTFITEYGVQIGSALEMLLLSVALGYRYAALRNENERIVREAKLQLEQKVEQRTEELRSALGQLGDAHARLRDSSQRDGLTGLHNRTHFRERLETLLTEARANDQPLSLLMIDLDHFKSINDEHGHLAGDECLRWAAHSIGEALRSHKALVARFGGEEFVAALPGHDLASATGVAETLRQKLREQPCRNKDRTVAISASFGVHEVDTRSEDRHPEDDIDAALQAADEALYRAKADGRDCVRSLPVSA